MVVLLLLLDVFVVDGVKLLAGVNEGLVDGLTEKVLGSLNALEGLLSSAERWKD